MRTALGLQNLWTSFRYSSRAVRTNAARAGRVRSLGSPFPGAYGMDFRDPSLRASCQRKN